MNHRDSKNNEIKNKHNDQSKGLIGSLINRVKGQKNDIDNKGKYNYGFTLPKGSKKKSDKYNKERLKELRIELKKLLEKYKTKYNEYQQVEMEYRQYHKICERCIKPMQYLLGYCKYNASTEKSTIDLVKKINHRYLDILISNIRHCGISISKNEKENKYKFKKDVQVFEGELREYNNFDFKEINDFEELENERNDMKYRIEKAEKDIGFIKKTYQLYYDLCKGVAPIVGKLLYYCRHDLENINDVISVSLELEKIMKEFCEKIRQYDIEIKYYEDLQEDYVELWFNLVEKGLDYPAVLKGNELFLDAYGQFVQSDSTNQ